MLDPTPEHQMQQPLIKWPSMPSQHNAEVDSVCFTAVYLQIRKVNSTMACCSFPTEGLLRVLYNTGRSICMQDGLLLLRTYCKSTGITHTAAQAPAPVAASGWPL